MKQLPKTHDALVLQTDFSDDAAWEALCAAMRRTVGEFRAYVEYVSAPAFEGLSVALLLTRLPPDWTASFLFVADRVALTQPEHPILVVDLAEPPSNPPRATLTSP